MYENEIYSGAGAGSNTSGADSTENGTVNTSGSQMNHSNDDSHTIHNSDSYGISESNVNTMAGGDSNGSGNAEQGQFSGSGEASQTGSDGSQPYGTGYPNGSQGDARDGYYGNGQHQYSTYQTEAGPDPSGGKKPKAHKVKNQGSGYFRKIMMNVSFGLIFGLFAGAGFYAVNLATGTGDNNQGSTVTNQSQSGTDVTNTSSEESQSGIKLTDTSNVRVVSSDVSDVVNEVMPAMVSIINNFTEQGTIFGQNYSQEAAASGTGIIIGESETELLIVSNYHVVADATKLDVSFIDGTTAEATIKGADADMDLAVIAIPVESLSEETKNSIAIATLGDSDALNMGEPVIAIGNALGYGQSVTNGIVSALDRQITLEDGSTGLFIQTNAAINPGNSGGALLNVNGEVIGINSNKIGGSVVEGMGYAIPISAAKPIIADLMLKETRTKVEEGQSGYLGISLQPITEQLITLYKIPQGIFVTDVADGSPAQAAGMLNGDIITKFEGEKITAYEDLQEILQYYGAGTEVTITVMRPQNGAYESIDLTVTLGSKPSTEISR